MTCPAHPWGLADGLACTGRGDPHAHIFIATGAPDHHDATEQAAEETR